MIYDIILRIFDMILNYHCRGKQAKWNQDWLSDNPDWQRVVTHLTIKRPGSDFPNTIWVTLNLTSRTGRRTCHHLMNERKLQTLLILSVGCDCG